MTGDPFDDPALYLMDEDEFIADTSRTALRRAGWDQRGDRWFHPDGRHDAGPGLLLPDAWDVQSPDEPR